MVNRTVQIKTMNFNKLNHGYVYAFSAYLCWGFFPIYWKFLKHVPLVQILAHRVLWAFVFYSVIVWIKEKKFSYRNGISKYYVRYTDTG